MVAYYYLLKGGEDPSFKSNNETILAMVPRKRNPSPSSLGTIQRRFGRPLHQSGSGLRGLHPRPQIISAVTQMPKRFLDSGPRNRHVCQSRKQKIEKILLPVPSLVSSLGGCFDLSSTRHSKGICQPSLDLDKQVAEPSERSFCNGVLDNSSLLGFQPFGGPFWSN